MQHAGIEDTHVVVHDREGQHVAVGALTEAGQRADAHLWPRQDAGQTVRQYPQRSDEEGQRQPALIEAMATLLTFYNKYQQQLSWLGGNFNQVMHRANELAIDDKLSENYFRKVVMPEAQAAVKAIREVSRQSWMPSTTVLKIRNPFHLKHSTNMIITILPSSANFHAIAYNEMKVEKGQATLFEVQNIDGLRPETYTADKLQWYFHQYSARNTYIKKPQFHVAVSCKGAEYSHQQLLDIAHRYLKEMGYAEDGQPLLVYAHHDTDNNHIHIVTSRVAPDGHKIYHHHEKRRSRALTLKIMKEYTGQKLEPEVNDIAKDALSYRYTSKAQFCAIMESL